ncbi:DUF5667 domain-containing protein, partial [Nocardioides aquaticus]|uniref:DUF5667 domain-containing protein n=1 Tax=Nocardioides aquaticus TaxID=160826 RepID=UPI0031DC2539
MTPGFTTRARAERFAAALDASRDAAPLGVDPAWLRLVDRLESGPEVQPRQEFASALREQLLTAARDEQHATGLVDAVAAPDPLDRLRLAPGRPRGQRRLTASVAALALVGAGGGMAVASQSALPGETLYPVKRALEDVRTGLEDDPSAKGTRLVAQARDRLTEVAALTAADGADPVAVERTLDDFAAQAREAADLKLEAYYDSGSQAEVLEVRDLATDSVAVLGSLEPVVPETALGALLRAAQDLRDLDAVARQACGGCGGPVVDLVPDLALDPASADLGRALGLGELRAAGRPDTGRGSDVDGGAGAGGPDGAARPGAEGRTPGDRSPRGTQDRQQGGQAGGQAGGQPGGQLGGGASLPVDGGSVPELQGPLR